MVHGAWTTQRSGCAGDEELLGGVVIFADSRSLTQVVLAVLQDNNLRRQMERRALLYIIQDQTYTRVSVNEVPVSSSLSHLVSAVNKLAGACDGLVCAKAHDNLASHCSGHVACRSPD
jgi:hypothetical protein